MEFFFLQIKIFISYINITLGPVVLCAAFPQFSTVYPEYSVLLFLHKAPKIRKKLRKLQKKKPIRSSVKKDLGVELFFNNLDTPQISIHECKENNC